MNLQDIVADKLKYRLVTMNFLPQFEKYQRENRESEKKEER